MRYDFRNLCRPLVCILDRTLITPNMVTVLGLTISVVTAYMLSQGWLIMGAFTLFVGSSLDCLDGMLARATGQTSTFGAFLDSTLDRLQESIILFGLLLYFLFQDNSIGIIFTFFTLISSFLVSYTCARAEGLNLQVKVGFMTRAVRIIFLGIGLITGHIIILLGIIAVLSTITALQRGVAVWRQNNIST